MYVEHLATGRESIKKVKKLKSESIIWFWQWGLFKLHKRYSKEVTLETNGPV